MIIARKGNGQTECYGCKQKGKFALHWDCFLYTYDNEAYCSDCLLEKLDKENQQLKEKYNKALELLASYKLPCDIDNFNTIEDNIEYCIKNCSLDEEIFIKCWDKFITQKIEKSDK